MLFSTSIYFLSLLTTFVIVQGQVNTCGENEVYIGCGSPCTETCNFKPQICMAMCKSGCFCKTGYVRQSEKTNSPCIKREECQSINPVSQCNQNEEFLTCGSACVETCSSRPTFCTEQCVRGCFCRADYVRMNNAIGSSCIPRNQCPK